MFQHLRSFLGTRSDWSISRPQILRYPSIGWLGPLAIIATALISYLPFIGATGDDGSVTLSLFAGAASIVLMAWSFVLALRIRLLEPFFGGLDRVYKSHRWAGVVSAVLMFLHPRINPEIEGGILGASKGTANTAEELAELGELMIYGLIGLSLLRMIPYRWWRWTHKLFGIPFAFASWHFFTAEKPYANGTAWGWYFSTIMVIGLAAWIGRVLVRDNADQGARYRVASHELVGDLLTVELAPERNGLDFKPGQFAFLRFDLPGLGEPHPFSIASSPSSEHLRFTIRCLGDWTRSLSAAELAGARVRVEGAYGAFKPLDSKIQRNVWIAGGVGIAPFLSALDSDEVVADLLFATRTAATDPLVTILREAERAGQINLHLFESSAGNRMSPESLEHLFGSQGLDNAHVALCGPDALVRSMATAARNLGASDVHTEDFDIRSGIGPERSTEINEIASQLSGQLTAQRGRSSAS